MTDHSARRGILNYLTGRSICQPPRTDDEAESLLARSDDDVLRTWAAKIREVGIAKGWSVWASAYMDPDVPFNDTGMPSTETIVAELRRLDRVAVLREAADAITAAIEADRTYSPRRSNGRAALGGAREIVLGLIDKPRRTADDTGREKDTSDDHQAPAGESTPASAEPYAATDPQNCRLTIVPVVNSGRGHHVEFRGEDLTVGGESVLVWLPVIQAKALDRCLHLGTGFEFADHSDDKLTVKSGTPWTVFTFARPSDAEEEAAVVRVVVLRGRLQELRRALRAAVTLAEQPTDYASRAPGAPMASATEPPEARQ